MNPDHIRCDRRHLSPSASAWLLVIFWLAARCCVIDLLAAGVPPSPKRTKATTNLTTRAAMLTLKSECINCHNAQKKRGGLVLLSREALLEGGDDGPVVVPGKPEASKLTKVLLPDADPHMPPKKQLTAAQLKIFQDWIKQGVPWDAAVLAEEDPLVPVALAALPASYQPVLALALSPDGKKLAVGRGGRVIVHDVAQTNFPVLADLAAHQDAVQALAWSSDGHWLASGAFRRVLLWNADSFRLQQDWTNGLLGRITAMKFDADATRLTVADGVGGQSGVLRVFSIAEGKAIQAWRAHDDTIFALDLSREGTQIVTAGGDKMIKVWDTSTMKELASLEGHSAQVLAVAFNTNATQVISGGADKQIRISDIKTRDKISGLGNSLVAVTALAWPGDGKTVVAVTEKGVFTYKNLKSHTGGETSASGDERKIGEASGTLFSLAVTPDASRIFAGSHEGLVYVWNNEGKLLTQLERPLDTNISAHPAPPPTSANALPSPVAAVARSPRRAPAKSSLKNSAVVALSVEPTEVQLSSDALRHGVLVTARTADGFDIDVTAEAKFSANRGAPFEVATTGELRAVHPGAGELIVQFKGKRTKIPVRVVETAGAGSSLSPPPASFVRDVLPVLSKAGCNAGSCHAKGDGQNGFKLSVFSYDPKADFAEIVRENRGRRVFPAAPEESLIIKKPTTALPHEGGLRFERGSATHQLLVRWVREGMAYALTNEPALERITVFPRERRYRKGAVQRLLVRAHYSDGSVRDATPLAGFDANDKEIAKVDEHGVFTIGTLTGQGVVVARYMGFVADAQIMVPSEHVLPASEYAALPRNNFIDDLACAQFQRVGLFPSELCTDAEFLRRAKLDAIGLLPTPEEVNAFLADSSPDKRPQFIARVLDDPAYADHWANKWADLLRPNPDRVGVKSVFMLDQWLRESFRQNKPYDRFVREILLAEGSNHRDGPAVIYRDRREPADLTTMFSQLFLGTRLECARCHHHPNEKWAQEDFYQFAAFFGPVKQKGSGLSPPISAGTETFYFAPGGAVKHPVSGAVMSPRPPDGPPVAVEDKVDPRRALSDWLTAPDNPFFARAAVNRVWAGFFGRGLVEPVDDFRISNPCLNPDLLTALASDFTAHGYDMKHLIRTIMASRIYQLSTTPNDSNVADTRNFSRAYRRRLPAEVLLDAVTDATGIPDTFNATPIGSRANQAWSYKIESHFLDSFGRPNASSDCPCERDTHMSVVQSLHLMNSKALQAKFSNPAGRARKLADSAKPPEEVITELYLATLSRFPAAEEIELAKAPFAVEGAKRQTAVEDILWALLNSAEFVFNH